MDVLLRLLARLLPPLARARYLEEWRADLAGAAETGMPHRGVVLGAAVLLVRIDRDRPEHSGEPRGTRPLRLARRGAALFVAASSIAAGAFFTGGGIVPEPGAAPPLAIAALDVTGRLVLVLAVAAAVVGVVLLLGAGVAASTRLARVTLVALVVAPAAITAGAVGLTGSPLVPLAGFALLCAALVSGGAVLHGSPVGSLALARRTATRRQRMPTAVAGLVLLLAVVVLGAIDLLVWNPLAKVPGLELARIYALMAERDGYSLTPTLIVVGLWAVFWTAAGVVVVAGAGRSGISSLTPRRLVILLLGLVGGAVFFRFFAGFGTGMSIADSFATDGGDGSLVSAVLPFVGQLALAGAAVAFGFAPRAAGASAPASFAASPQGAGGGAGASA